MRRIMAVLLSAVLLVTGLLQTGTVRANPSEEVLLSDGLEEALAIADNAVYKEGSITALAAAEAPGELITNGSYEILDGNGWASTWSTYVFSGTPVTTVDDAVYKAGSRSLKISASIASRVAVTKTIPVTSDQRGKTFKFKQWVKTENVSGSARNRIQYKNGQGVTVGDHVFTETIKGTQDWKLTETFITIPANPDIVRFVFETFFETGTGTAWYDGTSMTPWIPLEAIAFSQEDYTVPVGETIAVDASLIPANASEQELVWTTSDSAVASVQAGTVTGVNSGAAVVTAASSDGKIRASAIVFVGSAGGGVTAEDAAVETDQREAASGTIQAHSETGRPLTYEIAANPVHGLLGMDNAGNWSYYPDELFYGTDRFIVIVKDDAGNYAVSRVTVTVKPVNRPPSANDSVYPIVKNTTASGSVRATDPDGDSLSFEKASDPLHGQVVLQGDGKWTYTPDAEYAGEDLFNVRVSDGKGGETITAVRVYMAPLAEELVSELKAKNPDKKHSRLLATNEDFARIQALLLTDDRIREWFETVKVSADLLLVQPVVPYRKPDGLRLDTEASSRIANLAFVFRVTGEQKYLDRAWTELQYVSTEAYPDWSPGHFLDDATMTYGVSLGYDWLYDYLNGEQRDIVRHAIVEKGLKPALPLYAGMTYWTKNDNNWNFVCNAGMIAGALAVADEEEGIAGTILQGAFKSLQYGLRQYAPDGSSMEGPAYWSYGTDFLVYLLSSLETVYGHDFGFSAADGISDTPNYPVYITGPQGTFNYSDGSAAFIPGKLLLWFAKRYQEPGYAWYHQFSNGKAADIRLYDILWYRPELYDGGEPALKDNYFARQQAVTVRSSWTDPHALFAGFKGGVNGVSHSDLDIGSFVLDANGVRWATDPGSENYNLPGYWDMTESGLRWTYYRKRTEGHNTIVINPSAKPEQDVKAVSKITKFEDNREQGAFAIADMTEAYKASVTSARRGVALTDHRRQFLVQDEIRAKLPSELYWFMHTTAQIDIAEDGQTAILSSGDQRLQVQLLSPTDARFSEMDAVPLPTSPNPPGQTPNTGVKKLAIHLQNVKDTTVSVRMIPLQPGQSVVTEMPAVVPLDQWSVSDTLLAKLDRILLDGTTIAEFQPDRYMYTAEIPYGTDFPGIEAIADNPQHTVRVTEAASGLFRIDVEDTEHTADAASYYVKFLYKEERRGEPAVQAPIPGKPYQATKLPVSAVKASADDGNLPGNTVDGKLDTRWSASGEQWIQYDLGGKKLVRETAIAWYSGNQRSSLFDIEVSDNGYIWEWVYSGKSSGTTTDFETYALREATGRYVRIKGHGNTANGWNSIAEVTIHGESYKEPETSALVAEVATYSLRVGETFPLNVKGVYSDGTLRDVTAETVYFSEDGTVASVNANGVITGVAQGNTYIRMSYGGVEYKIAVVVSVADQAVMTGIKFDSNGYTVAAGDTRNMTVQALYSDGSMQVVTSQAKFSTSAPQIASMNGNGRVKAKKAGTAIITAAYKGFETQAEVVVE